MAISTITHVSARQANLHTHSWYCGHGTGELSEYVASAKTQGISLLGFSEHCPVPDGRWSRSRMPFNHIDRYMDECRKLQREEHDITIVCGFECDHDPHYVSWYNDRLVQNGFADYLAFGVHYLETPEGKDTFLRKLPRSAKWLHAYTDKYIDGLLSGTYLFGVHPDLFGMFYTSWDAEAISCSRSILECAQSRHIPLEINGYGCRKPMMESSEGLRLQYPLRQFWELAAEYDVPVVVNSDAHRPEDLDLSEVGAFELAAEVGIEPSGWDIKGVSNISIATSYESRFFSK